MPGGSDIYHEPGDPKLLAKAPAEHPEGTSGYHPIRGQSGESMFYIAGGGEAEERIHIGVSIRSPMFITIPYASKCMIGYKVADIPAIMGSFDPCIGETDR